MDKKQSSGKTFSTPADANPIFGNADSAFGSFNPTLGNSNPASEDSNLFPADANGFSANTDPSPEDVNAFSAAAIGSYATENPSSDEQSPYFASVLLKSEDVRLRACEPTDLLLMYSLENDSSVWQSTAASQPISAKALRDYIFHSQSNIYHDQQLRLTIDWRHNNEWTGVGFVDLFDFNARHLRAEVGIGLKKQFRRLGIAKQALALMEQYARDTLFLHQLYAYVLDSNIPSKQLFLSRGFVCVASLKDWVRTHNSYASTLFFQKIL